jgi:plastocyanin domain-containing protein
MKIKHLAAALALGLLFVGWAFGDPANPVAARPGASVKARPAKKLKPKARTIALSVTEEGFVPAGIKIKKGEAVNLVVTRRTDATCATQINIPDYRVSKDLPLNVPVAIALAPKAAGDIRYSCGMGMLHGVLTVE